MYILYKDSASTPLGAFAPVEKYIFTDINGVYQRKKCLNLTIANNLTNSIPRLSITHCFSMFYSIKPWSWDIKQLLSQTSTTYLNAPSWSHFCSVLINYPPENVTWVCGLCDVLALRCSTQSSSITDFFWNTDDKWNSLKCEEAGRRQF